MGNKNQVKQEDGDGVVSDEVFINMEVWTPKIIRTSREILSNSRVPYHHKGVHMML